jgi:hypothetical protein
MTEDVLEDVDYHYMGVANLVLKCLMVDSLRWDRLTVALSDIDCE